MEYIVYKMEFSTGVHIGGSNLEDSEMILHADTLFSAICQQVLLSEGEEALALFAEKANSGRFLLSDVFPYDSKHYYIPKPMIQISGKDRPSDEDPSKRKQHKKMQFIPIDKLNEYVNGTLDPVDINERIQALGQKELRTAADVSEGEDTVPYHIGVYHFSKGCGLYFILGFESEEDRLEIEDYLLGISGIGGKRSSGLGRFELKSGKLPENADLALRAEFPKYISLSVAMAEDNQLEECLKEAGYGLVRRGGFVDSQTYSQEFRRKNDVYLFAPGSVFLKRFDGRIIDVAVNGSHPVWRYAKPIWLGVEV